MERLNGDRPPAMEAAMAMEPVALNQDNSLTASAGSIAAAGTVLASSMEGVASSISTTHPEHVRQSDLSIKATGGGDVVVERAQFFRSPNVRLVTECLATRRGPMPEDQEVEREYFAMYLDRFEGKQCYYIGMDLEFNNLEEARRPLYEITEAVRSLINGKVFPVDNTSDMVKKISLIVFKAKSLLGVEHPLYLGITNDNKIWMITTRKGSARIVRIRDDIEKFPESHRLVNQIEATKIVWNPLIKEGVNRDNHPYWFVEFILDARPITVASEPKVSIEASEAKEEPEAKEESEIESSFRTVDLSSERHPVTLGSLTVSAPPAIPSPGLSERSTFEKAFHAVYAFWNVETMMDKCLVIPRFVFLVAGCIVIPFMWVTCFVIDKLALRSSLQSRVQQIDVL